MFGRVAWLPIDFNIKSAYDFDVKWQYRDAEDQDSFELATEHRKPEDANRENMRKAQNNEWLTNNVVDEDRSLLKMQYPKGIQQIRVLGGLTANQGDLRRSAVQPSVPW